jgi:hypothetical protein
MILHEMDQVNVFEEPKMMIKSLTAPSVLTASLNAPSLRGQGRRIMGSLRDAFRAPEVGEKPPGLRVSDRAWRRNSALLLSLYEQHGHDR